MRTESGADDSWEDKAEKEDALAAAAPGGAAPAAAAAAAAAKASRTSSPFASGGMEDDGRVRYTLDFMKKHRCGVHAALFVRVQFVCSISFDHKEIKAAACGPSMEASKTAESPGPFLHSCACNERWLHLRYLMLAVISERWQHPGRQHTLVGSTQHTFRKFTCSLPLHGCMGSTSDDLLDFCKYGRGMHLFCQ
jgi:hypothetical protein